MYRGLFVPAIALASHDSGSPARTEDAEMRKVVAATVEKQRSLPENPGVYG